MNRGEENIMIKPGEIKDKLITNNGFIIESMFLLSLIMKIRFQEEKIFAPNIGC